MQEGGPKNQSQHLATLGAQRTSRFRKAVIHPVRFLYHYGPV